MTPLITSVVPKSPAARAGIRPGWRLVGIDGHPVYDILDYRYWSDAPRPMLELEDETGRKKLVKVKGNAPLGLEFESYLMDNPRSCANRCVFCFIDQLPAGMRESLYFKDDDARLSFLQGNYITLTNLSEREIRRITDMRISPINISVHATDPELRRAMLGNPRAGECMNLMRRLAEGNIKMNCQIVCCPGLNDADALTASMRDLASLYPAVSSVSVVPVGLTRHRTGLPELTPCGKAEAEAIISLVDSFGAACLSLLGDRLFYCADELYLKAGKDIPPAEYYADYPQFENGVGMLRSLEDEFIECLNDETDFIASDFSIATGIAAAPLLKKLSQLYSQICYNSSISVFAVENRFFGESIDVAGLVTGSDLIRSLSGAELGERLLLPAVMLRHGGDLFLDNITPAEVERSLGVPLVFVSNDGRSLLSAMNKKHQL